MSNVIPFTPAQAGEIMEQVLIRGDIAGLTPAERARYYTRVCQSVGLNPLTRPFDYIQLNGKLTLYALKGCTDQLRALHGVSVTNLVETERDGVYVVTAYVKDQFGRIDAAKGAVNIQGLKGDALANAMMKAETKAKRRATLSLCGLGMLDETEIETIPDKAKRAFQPRAKELPKYVVDPPSRLLNRPLAEDMNDGLPGDLGPPDDGPSFVDLVER